MMGQSIDPFAVAECIRGTLVTFFLADHVDLEHEEVEIAEHTDLPGTFGLSIGGFLLEVEVRLVGIGGPRNYAHSRDVKEGDILVADGGFTCIAEGARLAVEIDGEGHRFVPCSDGQHSLSGQLNKEGRYVGLAKAEALP